jgi:hypothetical protein
MPGIVGKFWPMRNQPATYLFRILRYEGGSLQIKALVSFFRGLISLVKRPPKRLTLCADFVYQEPRL